MTIEQITDHAEAAKARLPSQFNGAVKLQALIEKHGGRIQELETVLFDLLNNRALSNATGQTLDNIGTILNVDRVVGETDDSYRARLFSETSQLEKSGEPEHLIEIFNFLLSPDSVFYQEFYPATVSLTAHTDTDPEDFDIDSDTMASMKNTKAGGVELDLRMASSTDYLMLSDESEADVNGNGPTDALHGLGDEALTEGGVISRSFGYPFSITNLVSNSENLDSTWQNYQPATVTPADGLFFEGKHTPFIVEDNRTDQHQSIMKVLTDINTKDHYCASILVSKDETPRTERFPTLRIKYDGSSPEYTFVYLDTSTGEIFQYHLDGDPYAMAGIEEFSTYWRIYINAKSQDPLNNSVGFWFFPAIGASSSWSQNVTTTGLAIVSGAQFRKGIYPGPYVKTTSTPVTRYFNG